MYKIDTRGIVLGIKALAGQQHNKPGGIDQVPHYTFKVRNRDLHSIEWYGFFVHHIKPTEYWGPDDSDGLKRCICVFMRTLPANHTLASDLDNTVEHLLDVSFRRKVPVIYGGKTPRVLYSQLSNGIEIHVLRETDEDLLSFGGFVFRMDIGTEKGLMAIALHRGVPLYNYMSVPAISTLIQREVSAQFPFIFPQGINNLHFLSWRERTRNQRELCNQLIRQQNGVTSFT